MAKENNSNGYIKLYRKLKNWDWYDDLIVKSVYIHILLSVNHKKGKWRGIVIEKGTFITSIRNLASEIKLSERKLRTSLKRLKSTHDIEIQTTHQYSIIKVVKWANYQSNESESDTPNVIASDTEVTQHRHTSDTRVTTNKNEKNKENEKNDKKEDINNINIIGKLEMLPYAEITNYWNDYSNLKPIMKLTEKRKGFIHSRFKEYGLDKIKDMIDNVSNSPFLKGQNQRGWTANFEWCFRPNNFIKILEGNYLDSKKIKAENDMQARIDKLDEIFPNYE